MITIETQKGTVYLDKINELVSNSSLSKKEKEKQALNTLIAKTIGERTLSYSSLGAPSISDKEFISVSHSKEYICIYISEYCQVGIDIQCMKKNILPFNSVFVNESEAQIVKNESLAIFKLWCAKECFFKEKQGKLKDLKNAARLVRLNPDNLVLENLGTEFTYEFKMINDYILVYSF